VRDGTAWRLATTPRLDARRDMLFSVAATGADEVRAVG
jgi:hypothetical protein